MSVTINVNGLSLSHKGDAGNVTSTLPDVCLTPSGGGMVPIPYTNVAFASDLINGTRTIVVDGGNMASIKGSEFYKSIGDEPGTGGGVVSGVNKHKATWLSWSPNVFMDGQAACRLTDKMLLNKGNTVSIGGKLHHPISGTDPQLEELCDIACLCSASPKPQQNCVAAAIAARYPNAVSPTGGPQSFWPEPVIRNQGGAWGFQGSSTGKNYLTTNWFYKGSLRPDVLVVKNGVPSQLVEMKMCGEVPGLKDTETYPEVAAQMNIPYRLLIVERDCDPVCCPPKEPKPVPVPVLAPAPQQQPDTFLGLSSNTWRWIGGGALVVGAVACAIAEPCGAAVAGALGLAGGGAALAY